MEKSYVDLKEYLPQFSLQERNRRWAVIWEEMRLNEMKTDLGKLVQEDRMISLGKLSASCVHEINNPIQGLLTFCSVMQSLLADGPPGQDDLRQFRDHLDLMSAELERCGNIVSGLLSFARESASELRDLELNDIIQSVLNLTKHRMALQNVRLTIKLGEGPMSIRGDVNQLQQCFLNLIFNALEAMPEGGHLTIISRGDLEKQQAMVIVRDSGEGISEEVVDHIFDPFFTTKGMGEGTGLGLSIVYGIVKGHEGRIEVKSKVGEGATFILNFPLSATI